MKAKLIEYAYPTSDTAIREGFGKSGCWFITLYKNANSWERLERFGFTNNKEEAISLFNKMPNPPHMWHKYFNA